MSYGLPDIRRIGGVQLRHINAATFFDPGDREGYVVWLPSNSEEGGIAVPDYQDMASVLQCCIRGPLVPAQMPYLNEYGCEDYNIVRALRTLGAKKVPMLVAPEAIDRCLSKYGYSAEIAGDERDFYGILDQDMRDLRAGISPSQIHDAQRGRAPLLNLLGHQAAGFGPLDHLATFCVQWEALNWEVQVPNARAQAWKHLFPGQKAPQEMEITDDRKMQAYRMRQNIWQGWTTGNKAFMGWAGRNVGVIQDVCKVHDQRRAGQNVVYPDNFSSVPTCTAFPDWLAEGLGADGFMPTVQPDRRTKLASAKGDAPSGPS